MMKRRSAFFWFTFFLLFCAACSTQKTVMQEGALIGNETFYVYSSEQPQTFLTSNKINNEFISEKELLKHTPTTKTAITIFKQETIQFINFTADTTVKDTTKLEPKLQPLIPAGAGIFAAGIALTAVSVISGGLSIFIGIGAFVLGLLLTNWGYKKVKSEPEKWKGEKLALAVYYALIPVGLFLMLYPVYLLFML